MCPNNDWYFVSKNGNVAKKSHSVEHLDGDQMIQSGAVFGSAGLQACISIPVNRLASLL